LWPSMLAYFKPYFNNQGPHCIVGQSNETTYPLFIICANPFLFLIIARASHVHI